MQRGGANGCWLALTGVLSIGKLGQGQADYYLGWVASGIEDYYTGAGEAPGQWAGAGCEELGLSGVVDAHVLRNVLTGRNPSTGAALPRPAGRAAQVPGYDFTFSAPKSVSLLFALGDTRVSDTVRDAHEAAVGEALGYLERHVAVARRGLNGVDRRETGGLVAARFRHRTSRAGDPQLHTHVLVANLVKAKDGLWSAPDIRAGFRHGRTAGFLYQAELRARLTRELGVKWRAVHNGTAEIVGVPARVARAFSRRRAEIEAELERVDGAGGRAGQVAALVTRKEKDYSIRPEGLQAGWREQAQRLGFGARQLEAVLERGRVREPGLSDFELRAASEALSGPEGLTKQASSFDRRDVIRAWCEQLPDGASVAEVEQLTDRFLTSGQAVPLLDPQAPGREPGAAEWQVRYSTPELLEAECEAIGLALSKRGSGAGKVDANVLERVLGERQHGLSAEQAAMVSVLCSSGDGLQVVVGVAGAGKTFALDAAREAWDVGDYRVIGCAVAAAAAHELQAGSGIASFTLAGLLRDLRDGEAASLGERTVVVVDEAGMAGTRDLAELIDYADRWDWKVVLCGDDRQLPEIDAGGLFRALRTRTNAVELTENHRQHEGWERDALDLLREGDVADALELYEHHDRIRTAESAAEVREQLVAGWWADTDPAHHGAGNTNAVMIAYRRADVADLNGRARALMRASGALEAEQLAAAGRLFSVGDRVIAHKNARHLQIHNRDSGLVVALDLERRELTIRADRDGRERTVPASYLDAGRLDHGYAITGHKAQGQTVERAHVLGTSDTYREWGYVALSRGRQANTFYITLPERDSTRERSHGPPERPHDPLEQIVRALERSRAQTAATDLERANVKSADTPALAGEQRRLQKVIDSYPTGHARELQRLSEQRREAERDLAQRTQQRAETERRREQLRWSLRHRQTVKELDHTLRRERTSEALTSDSVKRLRERDTGLRAKVPDRDQWVQHHAQAIGRYAAISRELDQREQHAARRVELSPPQYITRELGQRPDQPSHRREWEKAVRAIERYRERHNIKDSERALGQRPREIAQLREHEHAQRTIQRAQQTIQRTLERGIELEL